MTPRPHATPVFDPAVFLNPAAPAIVAAGPIKVLDRGHVALLHCAGTDALVAHAARASYGREGEPKTPEENARLVRRLMNDQHTSPFEMPVTWWHIKDPIYTDRQWVRHRMSSRCERSGRYTEMPPDEFQRTAPDAWRLQSKDNKQGSEGFLPAIGPDENPRWSGGWLSHVEGCHILKAEDVYSDRIDRGIAREQARKDLPLSAYTEWVWKIDLHNLLHFLRLRLAPDAQLEIRQYAQAIAGIVEALFPETWAAFVDYRLEVVTLSRIDIAVLAELKAYGHIATFDAVCNKLEIGKRERAACRAKLARLGLVAEEGGAA